MPKRDSVTCPHCGTTMSSDARFCPGCGTPRTHVREEIEAESHRTGESYDVILQRWRTSGWNAEQSVPAPPADQPLPPPPVSNSRSCLVIGLAITGIAMLLLCVVLGIGLAVYTSRFDVDVATSSEGVAARHELTLASTGRQAERWQLLVPYHQQLVPEDQFVACRMDSDIEEVEIMMSYKREGLRLLGTNQPPIDGRAVVVAVSGPGEKALRVVDMVKIDGEWRWALDNDALREFANGRCP